MGEYEPEVSRVITENPSNIPIEPERTGPREGEVREEAKRDQYEKQRKQERSDHDPKGRDLPRGSETSTRAASGHRT